VFQIYEDRSINNVTILSTDAGRTDGRTDGQRRLRGQATRQIELPPYSTEHFKCDRKRSLLYDAQLALVLCSGTLKMRQWKHREVNEYGK